MKSAAALAILGGEPAVRTPEGRRPGLSPEADRAARGLLHQARRDPDALADLGGGGVVRAFEEAFACQVDADHAVPTASGTQDLVAALAACGMRPGDDVVVSAYDWGGTAGAVLVIEATPVFVDIKPMTFNVDPAVVRRALTPHTRAILATHLFGHPADVAGLSEVARRHGVALVFDAAQALGASYAGQKLGGCGDVTVFSFGRGKLLTTGEGGMAVTNDPELYDRLVLVSQHPVRALWEVEDPGLRDLVDEVSLSCRILPLAAAIGLAEIPRLEALLQTRRRACLALGQALRDIPGFRPCVEVGPVRHAFHRFAITYVSEELDGFPRELDGRALRAEGVPVAVGPVRTPIHLRPRFRAGAADLSVRAPLKAGRPATLAAPVAERRCVAEELMLESSSGWTALPQARGSGVGGAVEEGAARSEKRRVGEKSRSRGWPEH